MGNTSEDKEESKFGKYMRELYKSPSGKLPSHVAVCRDAKIERNFYNRVKDKGFQGGVPDPKNVSALCEAIVIKESLKKPITALEVLTGLVKEGYLPEGSKLESEKEEQEDALQEDIKVEFDECAKLKFDEMQIAMDVMDVLNLLGHLEKDMKNKSSEDFGSWK